MSNVNEIRGNFERITTDKKEGSNNSVFATLPSAAVSKNESEETTIASLFEGLAKNAKAYEDQVKEVAKVHEQAKTELRIAADKIDTKTSESEKIIQSVISNLQAFTKNDLPEIIRINVQAASKADLQKAVDSIDLSKISEKIAKLEDEIIEVANEAGIARLRVKSLRPSLWMYGGQVATGVVIAMAVSSVFYFMNIRNIDFAKRAVAKIDTYTQKTKEILYNDFGGRP